MGYRGTRKHIKRLNAPSNWMLGKMGGVWAPCPSSGPHAGIESLPLVLILRNRLGYAINYHEARVILQNRNVHIDGKIRTDTTFPTGFQDIIEIRKAKKAFRMLYDTKGRFFLCPINENDAKFKLCRVQRLSIGTKNIPYILTHDGRTIRFPLPDIRVNDTIKLNLETGKIEKVMKFVPGSYVMISGGNNCGRAGRIVSIEKHAGAHNMVHVKDAQNNAFVTRIENVFVIGDEKSEIKLPSTQGVRADIIKNRKLRLRSVERK